MEKEKLEAKIAEIRRMSPANAYRLDCADCGQFTPRVVVPILLVDGEAVHGARERVCDPCFDKRFGRGGDLNG